MTPLATASFLSVLTFHWITPMMDLGYHRTLQATDLWKMDEKRSAEFLSARFEEAWARRVQKAKAFNEKLDKGEIKPSLYRRTVWKLSPGGKETRQRREKKWRESQRKTASLAWSLNDVLGRSFWGGGIYKVCPRRYYSGPFDLMNV